MNIRQLASGLCFAIEFRRILIQAKRRLFRTLLESNYKTYACVP